jgi:hypothetical protein
MPKKIIDYSNTIIYKIVCNDLNITEVYVGHTTNFINRKALHKSNCNNPNSKSYNYKIYNTIRQNGGFENWSMIEIEKFQDCNDINEATARERYYYELLNAKLNTNCPGRNKAEYQEVNKDKIKEYIKEYKENNKDKMQEYSKEYYEKNKDKIQEYRENNKDKMQEYYKNNKDKINEIKKTHYICDICNGTYTHTHRAQHFKSLKHQTALNNND